MRPEWWGLEVMPAGPQGSAGEEPALHRPVAPMLAAPVDVVPEGPGLVHEPKWDGWRAIAFREADGVYLQSRAGRNLTPYFPDITRAIRAAIPPGVVLDGELIVWERGRTNFAQLQRRVTAGRALLRLARECPAHYVLFDLLADADGRAILDLPLSQRRARLEQLLAVAPAQLTLTPQTADMRQVSDWLLHWTVAAGIEGVVSKRLAGRYEPGRRGWSKFRTRIVTNAIVGGVTGSIRNHGNRTARSARPAGTTALHRPLPPAHHRPGHGAGGAAHTTAPCTPRHDRPLMAAAAARILVRPTGATRTLAVCTGGPSRGGRDRRRRRVRAPTVAPPGPLRADPTGHVNLRRAATPRRGRRPLRNTGWLRCTSAATSSGESQPYVNLGSGLARVTMDQATYLTRPSAKSVNARAISAQPGAAPNVPVSRPRYPTASNTRNSPTHRNHIRASSGRFHYLCA